MRRLLLLTALTWLPFLSIFFFASQGDTSFWHISIHVFALTLLGWGCRVAWSARSAAATPAQRALGWVLSVTLPLAVLGHVLELLAAVVRLGQDGWVSKDTADLWERGPHLWASNLTIPAMMLSMLAVLAFVVLAATQGRRRLEPVGR